MSLSSLQMDLANDQKLGIFHIITMQLSGISRLAKTERLFESHKNAVHCKERGQPFQAIVAAINITSP